MYKRIKHVFYGMLALIFLIFIYLIGINYIRYKSIMYYNNINKTSLDLYKNGAIVNQSLSLGNNSTILLPNNIIDDFLYIKTKKAKLLDAEIRRTSELESSIGKYIKVFYKNNVFEGELLDYKNGKAYIKTSKGIAVVIPEAYIIQDVNSSTLLRMFFNNNFAKVNLIYFTKGIDWRINHNLFLDKKAHIESIAIIHNKDNIDYNADIKLVNDYLSFNYPIYHKSLTYSKHALESTTPSEENAEKTIIYELGKRSIKAKTTKLIKIKEADLPYKRVLRYDVNSLDYFVPYKTNEEKLLNIIKIKAPYNIASGHVYVYSNTFEGKVPVGNKAEGEDIELLLGKNFYVSGKTILNITRYRKEDKISKVKALISIKNYGKKQYNIEVLINMPLTKWQILNSTDSYTVENNKVHYLFSLNPHQEKNISLNVIIEH